MELHAPGGPVRSIKDFLVHIGVVTVGILIALGLEQLVESHHRSHLADVAVAGFHKELVYDEGQVKEVLAGIPALQAKVDAAIANLSSAPVAGGSPQPINYPGISLYLVSTASWDTAIATQSLTELSFDSVTKYAQAYGAVHLFIETERDGLTIWQGMHRFGTDPTALSKDQRVLAIEELRRYANVLIVIEFSGKGVLAACDAALK
ncbi:MAG TPA: hypothetical protein VGI90_03540 [Steroidobacteraceae bacterium]|jgi:hypothetical protein